MSDDVVEDRQEATEAGSGLARREFRIWFHPLAQFIRVTQKLDPDMWPGMPSTSLTPDS